MAHKFDNTQRSGSKAFVSEYDVTGTDAGYGRLLEALGEVDSLIGLETNRCVTVSMIFCSNTTHFC